MALPVILGWYLVIGVLAALGCIRITQSRFSPKAEQIFYGLLLTPVAAVYLAFTAYFGAADAWGLETIAAVLFAVLGVLGTRLPVSLMLGYALHGAWDLAHELAEHGGSVAGGTATLTAIPLAYGVFCAAFDWYMAVYFYTRREQWKAA